MCLYQHRNPNKALIDTIQKQPLRLSLRCWLIRPQRLCNHRYSSFYTTQSNLISRQVIEALRQAENIIKTSTYNAISRSIASKNNLCHKEFGTIANCLIFLESVTSEPNAVCTLYYYKHCCIFQIENKILRFMHGVERDVALPHTSYFQPGYA